jgi:outer membrane protein OmpA-like peptidoglycan-associated protein
LPSASPPPRETPPPAPSQTPPPAAGQTPPPGQSAPAPQAAPGRPGDPAAGPDQRRGDDRRLDERRPGEPAGRFSRDPNDPRRGDDRRRDARDDRRLDDLRGERRERAEDGGRRVIIEEPGNRTIVRENGRVIIRHNETERLRRSYEDVRVERRDGRQVSIARRPNGVEIITIVDDDGRLLRRTRRDPGGRETVLIDNRIEGRDRRRDRVIQTIELPPPVLRIPREEYIVEVEDASEADIEEAFRAPPVERIERSYTLEEVRQSPRLRERMRRVDLDTVTFEFGSWEVPDNQFDRLAGVARAMAAVIERNPNEIFLVEGHTDAVGSDVDNLSLSDRRAESVALVLSETFRVPAENLVTQGYGEQYLKVPTEEAERQNRRVTLRRITPLLRGSADAR